MTLLRATNLTWNGRTELLTSFARFYPDAHGGKLQVSSQRSYCQHYFLTSIAKTNWRSPCSSKWALFLALPLQMIATEQRFSPCSHMYDYMIEIKRSLLKQKVHCCKMFTATSVTALAKCGLNSTDLPTMWCEKQKETVVIWGTKMEEGRRYFKWKTRRNVRRTFDVLLNASTQRAEADTVTKKKHVARVDWHRKEINYINARKQAYITLKDCQTWT